MAESKIFKRQSGQIKAVTEVSNEILELTRDISQRVSERPPAAVAAKVAGMGRYSLVDLVKMAEDPEESDDS